MKSVRSALVLAMTCSAIAAAAVPATAATPTRRLLSGHLSISAVRGALPAGATVSVLQFCPRGSTLDRAATRRAEAEGDGDLDPRVKVDSREFWTTGTVSRYRVNSKLPPTDGVVLFNAALCSSTVPAGTKVVTGRAATDLRVWGPAPSRLQVQNVTVALVSDDINANFSFATIMRAGGVASSSGSLAGGLQAVQQASRAGGLSRVAAEGETQRSVRLGRFISMKNSYSYTSDLTRKVTDPTGG